MAEGLAKGVLDKDVKYNEKDPSWEELLITYHACHEAETGECSTLSYWNGEEEAWISFVMLQSGHSLSRQILRNRRKRIHKATRASCLGWRTSV